MRKVFAYVRVSTKEQAQHGYSIESQQRILADYAAGHDLEIAREFIEHESAFKPGREQFLEMSKALKKERGVTAILVYKIDRLARNLTDFSHIIEELAVEIISATEQLPNNAAGRLMGNVQAAFSRYSSEQLSERVGLGMATKAAKGLWPSSAPTGYRNVDRQSGKVIEVDQTAGPLVTRLFEKYEGGTSLTELERWARGAGMVSNRGAALSRSSIHRILRNPIYHGVISWHGHVCQGQHKPLVTRELWDACQDRLHGRAQTREQAHHFPFRGLLTCAYCGCQITASLIKGKYTYYHCTRKKGACQQPFVRAEELSNRLSAVTERVRIPADVAERLVSEHEAKAFERERERKARLIQAKASLRRATDLRTKAYTDKLENVIDEWRWGEIDRAYAAQEEDARAEVERWSKCSGEKADRAAHTFKLLDRLPGLYAAASDEWRAAVLRVLGSNYILSADEVVPVFKPPFDRVAVGVETCDWRSRRDSNPCPRDESPIS
jgi:site-specific DNA recombinase